MRQLLQLEGKGGIVFHEKMEKNKKNHVSDGNGGLCRGFFGFGLDSYHYFSHLFLPAGLNVKTYNN